jgi:hypothetical protein
MNELETTVIELAGHRCISLAAEGPTISDARDAVRLIEQVLGERASVVVVPAVRFSDAFFQLRTGVAGEVLQKMMNYRLKLAIVGDVSAHVAESKAFRDLVIEADRGRDLIVVPDVETLRARLGRA